jgi:hypothetical protein
LKKISHEIGKREGAGDEVWRSGFGVKNEDCDIMNSCIKIKPRRL